MSGFASVYREFKDVNILYGRTEKDVKIGKNKSGCALTGKSLKHSFFQFFCLKNRYRQSR